jgi:hypothetical protein
MDLLSYYLVQARGIQGHWIRSHLVNIEQLYFMRVNSFWAVV